MYNTLLVLLADKNLSGSLRDGLIGLVNDGWRAGMWKQRAGETNADLDRYLTSIISTLYLEYVGLDSEPPVA